MDTNTYTLEDYISLDDSELSEACSLLIELKEYPYILSKEFNQALQKELELQYATYKDSTRVEFVEHITTEVRKTLIWNDE